MSEQSIGGQEQDPQFTQRFIDALDSVQEYNRRHTGMGGAMRGFIDLMLAHVEEESAEPKEPTVSPADEAAMEKELVQLLQADELDAMGVTLFDTAAPGVKKFEVDGGEERPQKPSSLFMLITDKEKFEDTLWRLKPAPEQQEQASNGVASLLSSTARLIRTAYPRQKDGDGEQQIPNEVLETVVRQQLDMFIDLSPALVRQGFSKSEAFQNLTEYSARHASGILPEYREAEESGLLADEDRFGPAAWVRDMSAEGLTERWTKAFDLLERLRDKDEPTQFFTELFNKLRADFDTAKNWLDTVEQYDDTEYLEAIAEYQKARADLEARLKETLDREPTYDELYGEGTPQYPKSEGGNGYPKSYVDGDKEALDKLSSRWTTSFPLENSYYLSEQEEDGNSSPNS